MASKYIMVSAQINPGDVITEAGLRDTDHDTRDVVVCEVVADQIQYRGEVFPVWYVTGTDVRTKKLVRYTANAWRRWTVARNPVLPSVPVRVSA